MSYFLPLLPEISSFQSPFSFLTSCSPSVIPYLHSSLVHFLSPKYCPHFGAFLFVCFTLSLSSFTSKLFGHFGETCSLRSLIFENVDSAQVVYGNPDKPFRARWAQELNCWRLWCSAGYLTGSLLKNYYFSRSSSFQPLFNMIH